MIRKWEKLKKKFKQKIDRKNLLFIKIEIETTLSLEINIKLIAKWTQKMRD